jgi:hypothetical protein
MNTVWKPKGEDCMRDIRIDRRMMLKLSFEKSNVKVGIKLAHRRPYGKGLLWIWPLPFYSLKTSSFLTCQFFKEALFVKITWATHLSCWAQRSNSSTHAKNSLNTITIRIAKWKYSAAHFSKMFPPVPLLGFPAVALLHGLQLISVSFENSEYPGRRKVS